MRKIRLFGLMLAMLCLLPAEAQQLAFPGAQGWGRFAVGGRNGSVYHVTNLNDSGSGSLRDAVSSPNRIIVFDVAGVININSRIVFSRNLYVAGQTAPGEGITVYGDGVSFSGAENIIVRYMRFRMGHKGSSGKDCAGIANGANMIFDHCSFAWGLDETFSINPDGKGTTPENITLQNCIVGQGLMTHSAGGLMQTNHVSIIGNFLCDNSTRNFKIKGINQYANNIVYNWSNGAYIMGGDSEGSSYVNIQSNLFINGPAKGGAAFTGGNADFHCYGIDNWQDSNIDGVFDPKEITDYNAATRVSTPYDYPALELTPGKTLLETNLPTVGASLPYRDMTDCYMVDEVLSYGKKGALISNEETLIYGAPSTWKMWGGKKRVDSDNDGMPDEWESAYGTDPGKNDAMVKASNGYTNIENYINSITVNDRDYFLRAPVALELATATTSTLKITWCDYTFEEEGFAIEIKKDGGAFAEVGRTAAGSTSYTITGLEAGTKYTVRMRAFAGENTSEYTKETDMSTRPVDVGVIDIDSYEPELTWGTAITTWDFTNNGWNNGSAVFTDGKKTLFAPEEDVTVTLNETVKPAAVVVNSDANLTIEGSGAISGETSVNKAGEGTLTLNTLNTYTGATVLHEGTLAFNTLKNGGVASAIGQSVNFAQNWVMDGGTYRYTGGTTSTDRSAKLSGSTVFEIADAKATVTMNGVIEGTSAANNFILDGNGQLTVGTSKFFGYTGQTILRGGILYLSTTDISKAGIGSSMRLVMEGGHLKTKGESNGYETYSFPILLREGTVSQFSPNRNCYLKNKLLGAGTLQLNIPYLREYVDWDMTSFTGKIIANGISSEKEGSLFLLEKGRNDLSNCVVETKGNARICAWDTNGNVTLGGLSGASGTYLSGSSKNTKNFSCTWNVGTANTNETFAGTINNWSCSGSGYTGTVSIIKKGTGEWRLTGNNSYSGSTIVMAGRLVINGTNSGTGSITINKEAELAGKGTISGKVIVNENGTLFAGDTLINSSKLTLNGGLEVKKGGIVAFPLFCDSKTARTNKISVKNAVINDGVLVLDITNAQSIPDNQTFILFNDLTSVSGTGFTRIEPERPSATQIWDTSKLLTNGYLIIRADNDAIEHVNSSQAAKGKKYNLFGQQITDSQKGIYIQDGKKYISK